MAKAPPPNFVPGPRRVLGEQTNVPVKPSTGKSVPKTFDVKKNYRVQLTATVALPGFPDHLLRPSDDVVINGAIAEQLRSSISSAVEA